MIPAEALLDFVRDKNRLYQRLSTTGVGRSFPKKQTILQNPNLADFFREVLVSDYSTEKPDMNPSLDLCYKEGWLQAENSPADITTYVFPSRLHRGYAVLI